MTNEEAREILQSIYDIPTIIWTNGASYAFEMAIKALEEQERPTGKWYYSCQNGWHCSICQQIVKDMPTVMGKAHFDYCPNCGASMEIEEE